MDAKGLEYLTHDKGSTWSLESRFDAHFDLEYGGRQGQKFTTLYSKGKTSQWDSDQRLDWSTELDPENPLSYDDRFLPIYGSPNWQQASAARRAEIRHRYQTYTVSQFLHGEQAALLAAARLVEVLPCMTAKQFAAQQAADEARHVEVFSRLLTTKFGAAFEMDDGVQALIRQGLSDRRWDFVVLTTQILIEGLALGALQQLREFSRNPLISSAAGYVMADEARHVSFGLHQLEPFYAQLSQAELRERSQFAEEGLAALSRRLNPQVVWRSLGLDVGEIDLHVMQQGFPRVLDRLVVRVGVMLEKLRLRQSSTGGETEESSMKASRRLELWGRADEAAVRA